MEYMVETEQQKRASESLLLRVLRILLPPQMPETWNRWLQKPENKKKNILKKHTTAIQYPQ